MSPFEFSNHNSSSVTPHFSLGAISFFLRKYAKEYLHLRIQCYLCKQNILIWIFLWTFLSIEKENTHIYTPILSGYKKKKQLTVCSLTKLYKCLTYKSSLVCKKKKWMSDRCHFENCFLCTWLPDGGDNGKKILINSQSQTQRTFKMMRNLLTVGKQKMRTFSPQEKIPINTKRENIYTYTYMITLHIC